MPISSQLGSSALLPAGLGFRNVLINGNFDVWQRGTSFTDIATTAFSADRAYTSFAGFLARCTVTQNTSVPNARSKYSIRFQQPFYSSNTLTDYAYRQYVEGSNAQGLYGRVVTLSFWYKSSKTGSHAVRIDGSYATGGSNFTTTFTVSAIDTWEYKVITTSIPFAGVSDNNVAPTSSGAMVSVGFCVASGVGFSAVSQNDYFQISQLQLEANNQPTPFEQRPYGVELALCKRYYWRISSANANNNYARLTQMGFQITQGVSSWSFLFEIPMRATPTISGANAEVSDDVTFASVIYALSIDSANGITVTVNATHPASGATLKPILIRAANTTAAYLDFTAEL